MEIYSIWNVTQELAVEGPAVSLASPDDRGPIIIFLAEFLVEPNVTVYPVEIGADRCRKSEESLRIIVDPLVRLHMCDQSGTLAIHAHTECARRQLRRDHDFE